MTSNGEIKGYYAYIVPKTDPQIVLIGEDAAKIQHTLRVLKHRGGQKDSEGEVIRVPNLEEISIYEKVTVGFKGEFANEGTGERWLVNRHLDVKLYPGGLEYLEVVLDGFNARRNPDETVFWEVDSLLGQKWDFRYLFSKQIMGVLVEYAHYASSRKEIFVERVS
ncbi:MAG: hypothetical protein WC595_03965 [Candidatus Nanoarchaeia archaeon]